MDTHYEHHAPKNPAYANSCNETKYANNYVTFLKVSPFARKAPEGKWLLIKNTDDSE